VIEVFARLAELARADEACILVTVAAIAGSTPREAGAKMVVTREAITGTIGGGQLEFQAIETARGLLDAGQATPVLAQVPLGPAAQQCCGGHVALLYEPILPPRLRLALFGAGHVARALVAKLADTPVRVTWIDPRRDEFPADMPANATAVVTEKPLDEVARLVPGTHVLVMTHSHALDEALVAAVLRRRDAAWIGLIGSASKRARFFHRLRDQGFTAEDLARVTCPIGIPGVTGKEPGVIAIAVAAQLLSTMSEAPAATTPKSQWQAWKAVPTLS
jgi:xanthine dehydrogenase accessory factor